MLNIAVPLRVYIKSQREEAWTRVHSVSKITEGGGNMSAKLEWFHLVLV